MKLKTIITILIVMAVALLGYISLHGYESVKIFFTALSEGRMGELPKLTVIITVMIFLQLILMTLVIAIGVTLHKKGCFNLFGESGMLTNAVVVGILVYFQTYVMWIFAYTDMIDHYQFTVTQGMFLVAELFLVLNSIDREFDPTAESEEEN